MEYKLRVHHILCLQFYISKGYSTEFISNMDYLYNTIKDEDYITIIKDNDMICSKCPNLIDNKCQTIGKVNRYDFLILDIISSEVDINQKIKYSKLKEIIIRRVIMSKELDNICSDCVWHSLCSSVLKEKYLK